jgi:rubrerythrin
MAAVADAPRLENVAPSPLDRLLVPVHRLVWADARRRVRKLFRFAETEADGGRDLARAAELTGDGLLRRLYLRHALDEQRHADMFRKRAGAMMASLREDDGRIIEANWFAPGERGLDDLRVEKEDDDSLLAFLHLSERAAAGRFAIYESVLGSDPETRQVFREILRDEAFHMNYTHAQLKRVSPQKYGLRLWAARASRLWKGYLRVALAVAGLIGAVVLTVQYFVVLPFFALLAKRAARRAPSGWVVPRAKPEPLGSQYG